MREHRRGIEDRRVNHFVILFRRTIRGEKEAPAMANERPAEGSVVISSLRRRAAGRKSVARVKRLVEEIEIEIAVKAI